MTINKARKILGKLAKNLTDREIEEEIALADFLAEVILQEYPKFKKATK